MNTSLRIKLILLFIPILILVYVFLIRDRVGAPSIGGGSYDLTKMFTLMGTGAYLLVYNIALALMGGHLNRMCLLGGIVTLIIVVIMASRSF
ncbi:hypothetical protein MKQ70_34610 [Chitinophaga sedimenti]|uniref:hypothetical protein n=1 Tax=Chitinophaga sedimenti TaxID=2033606 RepID=UPI0020063DA1|nr:hypothetical protein [Chitinophaga sedimenti]MCK7559799.1 hypothetical protein [Chitinophaga sedimenti]